MKMSSMESQQLPGDPESAAIESGKQNAAQNLQQNASQDKDKPGKHTRIRYYTSLEECRLVELWRQNCHDIASYNENLPIFRVIADGMHERGIKLNKQEVRRRISTYRNRYFAEQRRIQSYGHLNSDWRLYSLIACLFDSPSSTSDLNQELKTLEIIKRAVNLELPNLPAINMQHVFKPLRHRRDPDGCPFLEIDQLVPKIKSEAKDLPKIEPSILHTADPSFLKSMKSSDISVCSSTDKPVPLVPSNHPQQSFAPIPPQISARRGSRRRNIFPRTGQITMFEIEILKSSNLELAKQRESQLLELKLEEKEFQYYQNMFEHWTQQQHKFLSYLNQCNAQSKKDQNC